MNVSSRLTTMIEIAIMTAIAVVFNQFSIFHMPYGGSITLVMVPIAVLAFRRGWIAGVISGFLTGLILLIFGGYVIHPVQAMLDYPVAFAGLGLAGLVSLQEDKNRATKMALAALSLLIAGLVRFAAHFFSGVVFFAEYAPKGQSVYLYSFLYNITYILPEVIISLLVMMLMIFTAPQLVIKQR